MQYSSILRSRWLNWSRKSANCATIPPTASTSPTRSRSSKRKPKNCATRSFPTSRAGSAPSWRAIKTVLYARLRKAHLPDWSEVHGDRNFRDDPALVCGFARFDGERAWLSATKKARHQGKGLPEFRHAQPGRLPQGVARDAAGRAVPVADLHVVDTPGAFRGLRRGARPGRGHRPQSARDGGPDCADHRHRYQARVAPVGRWRLLSANRGADDAVSSMRSSRRKGCAAILWSDAPAVPEAAEALKLTAQDIAELAR